MIPLIGFAPDVVETTPGAVVDCDNWIPSVKGMQAAPSPAGSSYAALASESQGAALIKKLDATTRFFAGTSSNLYEGVAGAWNNVSRGGAYSIGSYRWRFAQFGNDSLAVNKSTQLQRSPSTGAFANLTAPKASLIETVAGFVMLADCDDTGTGLATAYGDQSNRWWCSPIYDVAGSWAPSITTQCTSGLLVDSPGPITGLKRLGSNVVAYKERSIYVGTYAGPPVVWQWTMIPGDIGCASHEAVVNIGSAHLFVGNEDFYIFDGSRPQSIGENVRNWFFSRLNKAFRSNIQALHDVNTGTVWWFYPSSASPTGAIDSAIVYNYRSGRWGVHNLAVETAVEFIDGGITYDNVGALYSTYDAITDLSYDSPFWTSNTAVPAIIKADHKPYTLSGAPASWYMVTNTQGDDQIVTLIRRLNPRWVTQPIAAQLVEYFAWAEGGLYTQGPVISMDANLGRFDFLNSARWHKFKIYGAGVADMTGFSVDARMAGAE